MKVLIIEDELASGASLKKLIEARVPGAEVRLATTLKGGREEYTSFCPQVVMLDADLPDSGAFETMKEIRPSFSEAAVVVVSGFDEDSLALSAFQNGAADFLVKTEPVNTVQRIVFAHLRKLYATKSLPSVQ